MKNEERNEGMKMMLLAVICGLTQVACDNPMRSDGESTPAEDEAAIQTYTYTQTVNQASHNTTIRPVN